MFVARDREAATVDIVLPNVDCASIAVASAARRQPLHLRRREGHRRLRAQANIPAYIVPAPGRPRPDEPDPTSTTSTPLTTDLMPGGDFTLASTATTLPIANAGRPKPSTPENPRRSACLESVRLSSFHGERIFWPRSCSLSIPLQLERHDDAVRQSVARRQLKLGLSHYTRQDLEAARDAGTPLHIQVLGLATIASDVTPELARAAIASVQVLGAFQASPAVKAALADRTT
jgi:hypothetical protein